MRRFSHTALIKPLLHLTEQAQTQLILFLPFWFHYPATEQSTGWCEANDLKSSVFLTPAAERFNTESDIFWTVLEWEINRSERLPTYQCAIAAWKDSDDFGWFLTAPDIFMAPSVCECVRLFDGGPPDMTLCAPACPEHTVFIPLYDSLKGGVTTQWWWNNYGHDFAGSAKVWKCNVDLRLAAKNYHLWVQWLHQPLGMIQPSRDRQFIIWERCIYSRPTVDRVEFLIVGYCFIYKGHFVLFMALG